jgi:hypothetical protein
MDCSLALWIECLLPGPGKNFLPSVTSQGENFVKSNKKIGTTKDGQFLEIHSIGIPYFSLNIINYLMSREDKR